MHTIAISTPLPANLQSTIGYRCFVLYKTLERKKELLSKFIVDPNDITALAKVKSYDILAAAPEVLVGSPVECNDLAESHVKKDNLNDDTHKIGFTDNKIESPDDLSTVKSITLSGTDGLSTVIQAPVLSNTDFSSATENVITQSGTDSSATVIKAPVLSNTVISNVPIVTQAFIDNVSTQNEVTSNMVHSSPNSLVYSNVDSSQILIDVPPGTINQCNNTTTTVVDDDIQDTINQTTATPFNPMQIVQLQQNVSLQTPVIYDSINEETTYQEETIMRKTQPSDKDKKRAKLEVLKQKSIAKKKLLNEGNTPKKNAREKVTKMEKRKNFDKNKKDYKQAQSQLENAIVQKTMLGLEMVGQRMFLPFDSIYAIHQKQIHNPKDPNNTDLFEYHVVTKNPNGSGYVQKFVPKEWLEENVDELFLLHLQKHHDQKGWVVFDKKLNHLRVIPENLNIWGALHTSEIQPIYEYKPLRGDDKVMIVKCEVLYDQYSQFAKIKKMEWYVLTERESLCEDPTAVDELPDDPLATDYDGQRLRRSHYSKISQDLLCNLIGSEHMFLLKQACVMCGNKEKAYPKSLCREPEFKFSADFESINKLYGSFDKQRTKSTVTIGQCRQARMYDDMDLDCNNRHHMPLEAIGNFSCKQIYYYDMRQHAYHINVKTTQIFGIKYSPVTNKYYGLVNKKGKVECIVLEREWVLENFSEKFIQLVKDKAEQEHDKFVKLPIGKATPVTLSPKCIHGNPKVMYLQNGKDNCVFASMASALSYMGFVDLAYKVFMFGNSFMENDYYKHYDKSMGILQRQISNFQCYKFNRLYQVQRIKHASQFNLLKVATTNPKHLYHVVLRGDDGSANHCVAIFNNFIFDGNFSHAWELSIPNLTECIDAKYESVASGYMYVLFENMKK